MTQTYPPIPSHKCNIILMKQIPRDFHQYISHVFTFEQKFGMYQVGRETGGNSCPEA